MSLNVTGPRYGAAVRDCDTMSETTWFDMRLRLNPAAFLLASIVLASPCYALDPKSPITQYSHTLWQTFDGLPNNSVQAALQTRDGYLWIGTLEGLVRFDGMLFTTFDTQNTPALRHNSVVALCEDRGGNLWIGTSGGGITLYRDGIFKASYNSGNGLPNDYIRAIYEDRAGTIWITAHDGGLVRHDNQKFTVLTVADGLPSNSLRTVLADKTGALWIAADDAGISILQDGRIRQFSGPEGFRFDQVRVFHEDRQGRIWIGTRGAGLYLYQHGKLRSYTTRDGLPSNAIRSIIEDRQGHLWIGTESGGLARFRDGVFSRFSTREGLPHSFVRTLLEDKEGNLWVGTRGGLSRLKDKKVLTLTTAEGIVSDNVRAIFEDASGRIWIGTATGLNYLQDGRLILARLSGDWSKDFVRSIAQSRDGTLWFGTEAGLYSWREGRTRRYTTADGLPGKAIFSVLEDRHGRIWIGSPDGLAVLENGAIRRYSRNDGLASTDIRALAQDREGALWIGTYEGLSQFKEGRFQNFTSQNGLSHNLVTSLYADADNTLWVGTRGGLSRLRGGRFTNFTRRDGLLSDNVLQIIEDGHRHFWLTSSRGASRISRKDLEAFADGRASELHPTSFDTADGMKSRECNGEAQPAGWKARDGRIWLPTVHGAVVFDPREIRQNSSPPRVLIEHVAAGSKRFSPLGGAVSLHAGASDVEIQFTGISLGAPERVRFRYKLDGFDSAWVDASHRRSAFYTNLPAGEFQFRVMAYSDDGAWPGEEASLKLTLPPLFHQTAWFYLVCALAAAGLVVLAYRLRVRSIHRRYEAVLGERARIGREIHDTLMQGVTGVSLQLEVASQTLMASPAEAKDRIDRALTRLDGALAEARRCILELRSPEMIEEDMGAALRKLTAELAGGQQMVANVSVEGVARALPETLRMQLLRIAREAVTNAVVHSRAMNLSLHLRFEERLIRFRASDDGCGFDMQSLSCDHFGLTGMRERTEQIGGTLSVRTAPGQGTEISVAVPVP